MTSGNTKPLVTFTICAYSQEQFIREAVEGAFAQTYSPLEIILSDDCSKDRTFEIMHEMAEAYRGPHRLILNRNATNLGLAGHSNRLAELAHGQLCVGAAGDDVSLPERTALMVDVWEASNRRATSIHGRWIGIDQYGRRTNQEETVSWPEVESSSVVKQFAKPIDFIANRKPHVQGSCHTTSKRLFEVFGPLPEYVVYEDIALAFRSLLVGEIHFINRPLVKYRRHSENTFAPIRVESVTDTEQLRAYHQQVTRELGRMVRLYDCFRADVQLLVKRGELSLENTTELEVAITKVQRRFQLQCEMYGSRLKDRLRIAFELIRDGHDFTRTFARLLPRPLSELYFLTRVRLRRENKA
jgi:glycosyltransferase involved in cell wall biosynthesis